MLGGVETRRANGSVILLTGAGRSEKRKRMATVDEVFMM
jgi:hypothetical protein